MSTQVSADVAAGNAHDAGVMLDKGAASWDATVRVWSAGHSLDYRLDRWD